MSQFRASGVQFGESNLRALVIRIGFWGGGYYTIITIRTPSAKVVRPLY